MYPLLALYEGELLPGPGHNSRLGTGNMPRDKVVVVHDSMWVDLVQQYGFTRRPIIGAGQPTGDPPTRPRAHVQG